MIGASGQEPSRTASRTASAQAAGSGSADSNTEFVMNQPTESCHRSWERLWTGNTTRSGAPAVVMVVSVITETVSASVETAASAATEE